MRIILLFPAYWCIARLFLQWLFTFCLFVSTIPSRPPGAFRVVFLHFEALSYRFCSNWLNPSRKYSPILPLEFVHILPSAVTSPINTSDPLQTASMCHNTASTAFDRWRGVLRMLSCSSPSFCTALKIKWSTSLAVFRRPSWSGGTWNHHGRMYEVYGDSLKFCHLSFVCSV